MYNQTNPRSRFLDGGERGKKKKGNAKWEQIDQI